jgi:hypothetical protein
MAEKAEIRSNIDAVGSVALAGVAALCGELARLGALDPTGLRRIAEFMAVTVDQSGGGQECRGYLHAEIERHFSHLQQALATAPPTTGSAQ